MLIVTSFDLDVYFVSAFYVCLLALTRYFMIKQTLNIVVSHKCTFCIFIRAIKINDHRKGRDPW